LKIHDLKLSPAHSPENRYESDSKLKAKVRRK